VILLEEPKTPSAAEQEHDAYMQTDVDYRSLEGTKVKKFETETYEDEGESFNDVIRRRTIDFNRRLDAEPENVTLWLDFIRFQDEAAAGLDSSRTTNAASVNQVKLSIFEKALEENPSSEELVHAYLQCGAETWDTLKLLREWDRVLKDHPDSIKLWADYINLRQTNFSSFTYTQCVQVFEDALSTLASRRGPDVEELMVYILLRACLFMKQAGYPEKAFAILQAAVEYNLFAKNTANKEDAFVEFWDSEVPRFGEEGARGWNRSNDESSTTEAPIKQEEEEIVTLDDWVRQETADEQTHRLPLRMSQAEDDSMDDDPYRIVLSDDIRPFLFDVSTSDARQSLIYSVLVFLGLPYTPPEVGTNSHFYTDTFTHNDTILTWPTEQTTKHLLWYVSGVPMNPEQTISEMNPYFIPGSYPVRMAEMFAKSGKWFKSSGKEFIHCQVDEKFTR
jgi:tetratricopeptide (TPR) repeat protein